MSTLEAEVRGRGETIARGPWTLWVGLGVIVVAEVFLAVDVANRGGQVVGHAGVTAGSLPAAKTLVGWIARQVATNMTVVCWMGYLLALDGVLTILARRRGGRRVSSIRARPHRFVLLFLTSVPVWCFFDWVNFYYMGAWRYHGLPALLVQRWAGYFLAFAAISPGMFLAAQFYQYRGVARLRIGDRGWAHRASWWLTILPWVALSVTVLALLPGRADRLGTAWGMGLSAGVLLVLPAAAWAAGRGRAVLAVVIGASFVGWTFYARAPIGNLTLWAGLIYLLDPINDWLGAPSLMRDWSKGRFGRTVSLMLGGGTCGLLWEFWNYWAVAKWTYHLPFLGPLEHVRYFEMPVLGFLGFLPFACECWVMANTILRLLQPGRVRLAEPLPTAAMIL